MDTLVTSTSGDIAGTAIGAATIVIAIATGGRHFRGLAYYAYIVSILSCLAVSTYSMFGTSIAIEVTKTDTYDFYYAAQQYYLGGGSSEAIAIGPNLYSYILSWFFTIFGPSPFLTNNLGILSFSLACVVIAKIYAEVNGANASTMPLVLVLLSPATIFHASLSWREPHQILALALATYYAVRYLRHRGSGSLVLSFLFLIAGSLIHNKIVLFNFAFAIAVYLFATVSPAAIGSRPGKQRLPFFGSMVGALALALALFATYTFLMSEGGAISKVFTDGAAQEALQDWRGAAGGRTKFLWDMDFDSVPSMVSSFPLILLQFLVAPLIPFDPDSILDFAAAGDGIVRVGLLMLVGRRLYRARGREWWDVAFLVTMYLAYCTLVALGTGNAGTALRHQIKMSWMLIIISGPMLAAVFATDQRTVRRVST